METIQKFPHSFTVTGASGVGTTTTCKQLFDALHAKFGVPWRWINAGIIMRRYAEKQKMDIDEFVAYMSMHPELCHDEKLDSIVKAASETDYLLSEGRLSNYNNPRGYHVFIGCDLDKRALRRFDDYKAENPAITLAQVKEKILQRDIEDKDRFIKKYGPDAVWAPEQFDCVVNTDEMTTAEIVEKIIADHKAWVAAGFKKPEPPPKREAKPAKPAAVVRTPVKKPSAPRAKLKAAPSPVAAPAKRSIKPAKKSTSVLAKSARR